MIGRQCQRQQKGREDMSGRQCQRQQKGREDMSGQQCQRQQKGREDMHEGSTVSKAAERGHKTVTSEAISSSRWS